MGYQDKYSEYLESIPDAIQKCETSGNRLVLGYTSDLDAILSWNVDQFNELLTTYMDGPLYYEEEELINSMADFVRILSYYASKGLGGEAYIGSADVVDSIQAHFKLEYSLGGTCAQGAAALGTLGLPAIIHITDRSQEVIDRISYPSLESVRDGMTVPLCRCVSGEQPLLHLIIQYNKGDKLQIHGETYQVPVSNRMIVEYDNVHKIMPVETEFLTYIENHANQVYAYDVSGFSTIVDAAVAQERMEQVTAHFRKVKVANPTIKIYFESAHYISSQVRDIVYSRLSEFVDIMGMNEEELVHLAKSKGLAVDQNDASSVIDTLDRLLELYPVKGIIMHSKDYSLYCGSSMADVDIEKGLTLGNLLSGTRARIGRYGTLEDCRETLKLPLSPVGLEFAETLDHMELKHTAVVVPSRYMEKPVCTIGLGDTFVAGVQVCFVR